MNPPTPNEHRTGDQLVGNKDWRDNLKPTPSPDEVEAIEKIIDWCIIQPEYGVERPSKYVAKTLVAEGWTRRRLDDTPEAPTMTFGKVWNQALTIKRLKRLISVLEGKQ